METVFGLGPANGHVERNVGASGADDAPEIGWDEGALHWLSTGGAR